MSRLTERKKDRYGNEYIATCGGAYFEDESVYKALEKLAHYEDLEEAGRLIELPCKVGDVLYKIVQPYRQPLKITKYRVKNFKTIKKGQKLQIEVQADSSPCKSWANFENFYTTKEEAEAKLAELGGKA